MMGRRVLWGGMEDDVKERSEGEMRDEIWCI
jgi:hypothetical protein